MVYIYFLDYDIWVRVFEDLVGIDWLGYWGFRVFGLVFFVEDFGGGGVCRFGDCE